MNECTIIMLEAKWNAMTTQQRADFDALCQMTMDPVRRRDPNTGTVWVYAADSSFEAIMDGIEGFLSDCGFIVPNEAYRAVSCPDDWQWDLGDGTWL